MRVIVWLVRAFIFFTLFAFALNNQQPVTVHWFFGFQWQAPLVIVMLLAVGTGAAIGVIAMLPGVWQRWRQARPADVLAKPAANVPAPTLPPSGFGPEPPRSLNR